EAVEELQRGRIPIEFGKIVRLVAVAPGELVRRDLADLVEFRGKRRSVAKVVGASRFLRRRWRRPEGRHILSANPSEDGEPGDHAGDDEEMRGLVHVQSS